MKRVLPKKCITFDFFIKDKNKPWVGMSWETIVNEEWSLTFGTFGYVVQKMHDKLNKEWHGRPRYYDSDLPLLEWDESQSPKQKGV